VFCNFVSQSHFLRVRSLLASPFPGHYVQTLTLHTHRNDDKERRGQSAESVRPFSQRDAAKSHTISTYWVCYRYIVFTARRYASAVYAIAYGPMSVCLSIPVCVCHKSEYTKTAGRRIIITVPHNSTGTLVFRSRKMSAKFDQGYPIRGRQIQVGRVKIVDFRQTRYRPGRGETLCLRRRQFDDSKNRGGSTSVCGRVRSPHISGGRRWLSCRQPACL